MTVTNRSGGVRRNYPLQFGRPFLDRAIAGEPQVLINGSPVPTQADVKNRYPDGSVKFAVIAIVIPTIPASGSLTLTFRNQPAGRNTPLSRAQMLDPAYDFGAQMTLTPATGPAQLADARKMLTNGDYKLWTAGPIAQTIMLADDSTARKYDLGFGPNGASGGYHPFRPRFYATFWPLTHQVAIRAVGENGNTQELEDLAYKLSISAGAARPMTVYTADLTGTQAKYRKLHWALSNWSQRFWLHGAPPAQVDIDDNLAYLAATRFIPNYDLSITVPEAAIARQYALWTNHPHDIYDGIWDGGQFLVTPMGDAGAHPEIGPVPTWDVLWLYTGDWRMRLAALGATDNAGAFPANLREGDPTKRLSRADPAGLNPETGLGHTVSITDRPTLLTWGSNLTYSNTKPADKVKIVGPINWNQPWTFDGAHQPPMWFVPYILTGDPWYLNEMYLWGGFSAARYTPPRGPGRGDYGGIADELRGGAWVERNRAETAFAAPDADPEKAYFTYLANDALARWEGGFGITGTPFDGTAIKVWGRQRGNPYAQLNPKNPANGTQPPLRDWQSNCDATANPICNLVTVFESKAAPFWVAGAVGSFTEPFMEWYVRYMLGRVEELGFAAEPLQAYSAPFLIGMIDNSGLPSLINAYFLPVEKAGGGYFPSWSAVIATFQPDYANTRLPRGFANDLGSEGYPLYALSGLSYETRETGGAQAWRWLHQNAYLPALARGLAGNPKWAIMPRTDHNVLPAISTRTPPS